MFGLRYDPFAPIAPPTEPVTAVLIDPFTRSIEQVLAPPLLVDALGQATDQARAENKKALCAFINPERRERFRCTWTALRHDCIALIDDEGLVRDHAAYWRFGQGWLNDREVVRGGRYLLVGIDPNNPETEAHFDVPDDLGALPFSDGVVWLDREEGRTWCEGRGILA